MLIILTYTTISRFAVGCKMTKQVRPVLTLSHQASLTSERAGSPFYWEEVTAKNSCNSFNTSKTVPEPSA